MKKLIIFFAAISFSLTAVAQTPPPEKQHPELNTPQEPERKNQDCYLMKDGKVWQVKDNKTTALLAEIMLKDSTRLKPDGTVILATGVIILLKEGDRIFADGHILKAIENDPMGLRGDIEKQ